MKRPSFRVASLSRTLWPVLAVLAFLTVVLAQGQTPAKAKAKVNRYLGAETCKMCHQAEASGNQYDAWKNTDHAKAFETLAGDKAKAFAKERGIDDAQKSDKCIACHQTAFGAEAAQIKAGFDAQAGVQCESCHGPGEQHFKARFAAAASEDSSAKGAARQTVPEGEIVAVPPQSVCLGCHNDKSPTFKPFCYYKRVQMIRHDDPRKPRDKGEILVCGCGDDCKCVHGCDEKACPVKAKDAKKEAPK
jgi:hypothetical protein